jgi:hypothetical protein
MLNKLEGLADKGWKYSMARLGKKAAKSAAELDDGWPAGGKVDSTQKDVCATRCAYKQLMTICSTWQRHRSSSVRLLKRERRRARERERELTHPKI